MPGLAAQDGGRGGKKLIYETDAQMPQTSGRGKKKEKRNITGVRRVFLLLQISEKGAVTSRLWQAETKFGLFGLFTPRQLSISTLSRRV